MRTKYTHLFYIATNIVKYTFSAVGYHGAREQLYIQENLYLVGAIPGKFTPSNLLGTHVRKQGILTLRLQYIPRILRVLKYLRA